MTTTISQHAFTQIFWYVVCFCHGVMETWLRNHRKTNVNRQINQSANFFALMSVAGSDMEIANSFNVSANHFFWFNFCQVETLAFWPRSHFTMAPTASGANAVFCPDKKSDLLEPGVLLNILFHVENVVRTEVRSAFRQNELATKGIEHGGHKMSSEHPPQMSLVGRFGEDVLNKCQNLLGLLETFQGKQRLLKPARLWSRCGMHIVFLAARPWNTAWLGSSARGIYVPTSEFHGWRNRHFEGAKYKPLFHPFIQPQSTAYSVEPPVPANIYHLVPGKVLNRGGLGFGVLVGFRH